MFEVYRGSSYRDSNLLRITFSNFGSAQSDFASFAYQNINFTEITHSSGFRPPESGSTSVNMAKTNLALYRKTRDADRTPLKAVGRPRKFTPMEKKKMKEALKISYSVIGSDPDGRHGANGTGEGGCYGELTPKSLPTEMMIRHKALTKDTKLLELGSGAAKVNNHTTVDPGVAWAHGLELEEVRAHAGINYTCKLRESVKNTNGALGCNVTIQVGDGSHPKSYVPFSTIYMYNIAVSASQIFLVPFSFAYLLPTNDFCKVSSKN